MRYLGGKNRLGKQISQVLLKYAPPDTVKGYCEPFCGSLGVMVHMVDHYKDTRAYDKCKDIILLWKGLKSGKFKLPRNVSEKTWNKYKKDPKPSAMRAFVGFGCSYAGRWFNSYIGKYPDSMKYIRYSINSTKKKGEYVKKIKKIGHKDYRKIKLKGFLIYCDPPYNGTTNVGDQKFEFDSELFWDTVRRWSKNNVVIVSEYKAPKDFKCIWKKEIFVYASVKKKNGKKMNKTIEKLFIHKTLL